MSLSHTDVKELIRDRLWPAFRQEKEALDRLDKWWRWDHDPPHQPRQATKEYKDLRDRAQTPWLGLVVTSVAQALYVEGYRRADADGDADAWAWWQANRMDGRQIAVHRSALGYGLAYVSVLPGEDELTGDDVPLIRGHSPRRMMAFYKDPAADAWPMFALQCEPRGKTSPAGPGWDLRLYDDQDVWICSSDSDGGNVQSIEPREHGVGVCPIVRFSNLLDLEARSTGEVEPYIAIASRIDQTVFDRLVVQRFASWVVRTIAGMSAPEDATDEQVAAEKLRLKVEDILIADDSDTKFGSLPASDLKGFLEASEADIRALAAVSQTPAHELLGQLVNLSAEALAAARASRAAKVEEREHSFGESWEQVLRLAAWIMGDTAGASDHEAQVRWRDTEVRSLAQAADALGKLATMLNVPVEILWEKIPGWTQQDVERAKALVEEGDAISQLRQVLDRQTVPNDDAGSAQ